MLRNLVMVGLVVAGLGTIGVASTPDAIPGAGRWPGANTPLGRMISGNLGRLMVLRSELNLSDEQRSQVRDVLVRHLTGCVCRSVSVAAHLPRRCAAARLPGRCIG
jgi:hypothetical protein